MSHIRSLNRVILVGRVGRDPEISHIPSLDRSVAKFGLATNEGYMDKNNEWKELTEWHNIVAWGRYAQRVERHVTKGALLLIEGRLKTRKWQDKEGHDRRTTEINVDNLVVLERMDRGGSGESGGSGSWSGQARSKDAGQQSQAPPERDIDDFPYDEGEGDPF